MAVSKQLDSILGKVTTATPATKAAPKGEIVNLPTAETVKPVTGKAKAAEPQKSVQAYVPASVDRALRMRAAEEGTTTRTLLLQGLKAIGFDVADEEMRDKRGRT